MHRRVLRIKEAMMTITVMGAGCATCKKLHQAVLDAVEETGVQAEVIYETDMATIVSAGIVSTPALMIDGVVVALGRAPRKKEIIKMIENVR